MFQHVINALAISHDNDAACGVAHAVVVHHSPADIRANLHEAHIAHADGCAIRQCPQGHLLDVGRFLEVAAPAHHVFPAGELQDSPANFLIALADLLDDLVNRDLVGQQFVGVDRDLVLLDESPDGCDFRHAGDCAKLVLYLPVLQTPQISQRVLPRLVD